MPVTYAHASVYLQRIFAWLCYDQEYLSIEFENADHFLLITYIWTLENELV